MAKLDSENAISEDLENTKFQNFSARRLSNSPFENVNT
jgi:hypothetical protein